MGLSISEKDPKTGELSERAMLTRLAMDNLVGYAGDKLRERLLAGTPAASVDINKLPKKHQGIIGIADALGLKDIILQKVLAGGKKAASKGVDGVAQGAKDYWGIK